jgi:hypothetical protein
MMRVLLVQPDYLRPGRPGLDLARGLLPSRSLLELAGVLQAGGHEVSVLDSLTALTLLEGAAVDVEAGLDRVLAREHYDVVGIAVYTATRREARRLARLVKRRSPRTKVIAGGLHASMLAEGLLRSWRELDYVCLGAAEESLPALLRSLEGKSGPVFRVKNIAFRAQSGHVRLTGKPSYHADLSRLPPVSYRDYQKRLGGRRLPRAYVMTARGCVHWCNFCSQLWKKVLLADPREVAEEITRLVRECGTEEIVFYDDCFGMRPDHAQAVLAAVKESGVEVRLQAVTRFDAISAEWLDPFRGAGGRDLLVGLESGAPRLRKRMNKHIREGDLCRGAELTRQFGLRLGVFLMFGFPHEEERDVEATYRLLQKLEPAHVISTVFDIKPGDLLFEFALQSQSITPAAWLEDEPRIVNGMEAEELARVAARAMAFDRAFTREVIMPAHDSGGFILGLDEGRMEPLIERALAR